MSDMTGWVCLTHTVAPAGIGANPVVPLFGVGTTTMRSHMANVAGSHCIMACSYSK